MISEFLHSPKTIGAVVRYSSKSITKMLSYVDRNTTKILVEFGPGKGSITQAIFEKLHTSGLLTSFELNQDLFQNYLKELTDPRLRIIYESCETIDQHFENNSVDYIVSTIPLSLLKKEIKLLIFQKAYKCLKPGGLFITGQYSASSKQDLQNIFGSTTTHRTLGNLPPMCTLVATKPTILS